MGPRQMLLFSEAEPLDMPHFGYEADIVSVDEALDHEA